MSLVHLVHSTEEQNGGVASAVLSLNKNLLENGVDSSIQVKSDLHNLDSKKISELWHTGYGNGQELERYGFIRKAICLCSFPTWDVGSMVQKYLSV